LPGALEGRRIWFVGIGGAGLSGYARLARAWGAEVAGWDKVGTPYVGDLDATIAPEPVVPDGWEVVVSTAYRDRVEGRSRAEFLAELVSLQRSIVVSGAHGKTTTTAMIAFALDRLGHDPSFLIGGDVPQLGGNARAGTGWLVAEGDESDRTIAALRPDIAVVLNVDLDHHSEFGSLAEVEALFDEWLASVPKALRGPFEPAALELVVPGDHNRRNAAAALAALEAAGVEGGERVLPDFRGVGRRFEPVGEAGGVTVVDDYAHNPAKVAALLDAARERTQGRVLALFQPHLPSRTRHVWRELGSALTRADAAVVTEIYAAREEVPPGLSGRLVVDSAGEARPGMTLGWAPELADAARLVSSWARPGDLVLTIGAGDVDRAAPLIVEALDKSQPARV
jgi:UDP-N-acetylmuramate--alanine ligase